MAIQYAPNPKCMNPFGNVIYSQECRSISSCERQISSKPLIQILKTLIEKKCMKITMSKKYEI